MLIKIVAYILSTASQVRDKQQELGWTRWSIKPITPACEGFKAIHLKRQYASYLPNH